MPASDGDSIANLLRKNKRLSRDLSRMETVFNAIRSPKSKGMICALSIFLSG